MLFVSSLVWWMWVLWMWGCVLPPTATTTICHNNVDCLSGEQCLEGQCVHVDCLGSSDCALEEYCSPLGECVTGCKEDSDCVAGEECSAGQCVSMPCRTAQLDCAYGEECLDGVCEPSPLPSCALCGFSDWQGTVDAAGAMACVFYTYDLAESCNWREDNCVSDARCYPQDGEGNVEDTEGFCVQSYWYKFCSVDTDCPRPFVCKQDVYGDGSGRNVCWADCPFWREQGVF